MKKEMNIKSKVVNFTEKCKEETLSYMRDILESGNLTLGKYTSLMENIIKEKINCNYAIAVNSGTSACEIILRILGIQGKKVLVPTNTFAATIFAIIHAGGIPVFVDNMEGKGYPGVEEYMNKIDSDTKAAIIVHIGGEINSSIVELSELLENKGIYLVEDGAHALGSKLDNKYAGTFGIAGSFSFYPTKVVTSGEGGCIVTDDYSIYEKAIVLRDQGKKNFYNNYSTQIGNNWRISEFNAALGYAHVKELIDIINHRNKIANIYNEALKGIQGIKLMPNNQNDVCNYYKYIVYLEKALDVDAIKKEGKELYGFNFSGEVYKIPCHIQPPFKEYIGENEQFPNAELFCMNHIALPMYNSLALKEAEYIISSFIKLIN